MYFKGCNMSKEQFLEMFRQCVEDGNIVIGLEKDYDYDNYVDIYPRIFINNLDNEEIYDSRNTFKHMGFNIKE